MASESKTKTAKTTEKPTEKPTEVTSQSTPTDAGSIKDSVPTDEPTLTAAQQTALTNAETAFGAMVDAMRSVGIEPTDDQLSAMREKAFGGLLDLYNKVKASRQRQPAIPDAPVNAALTTIVVESQTSTWSVDTSRPNATKGDLLIRTTHSRSGGQILSGIDVGIYNVDQSQPGMRGTMIAEFNVPVASKKLDSKHHAVTNIVSADSAWSITIKRPHDDAEVTAVQPTKDVNDVTPTRLSEKIASHIALAFGYPGRATSPVGWGDNRQRRQKNGNKTKAAPTEAAGS